MVPISPHDGMTIAIVGAGFSGSMLALQILRADARARVVLIERASFARGLAYGAADPGHLLNVRAANMSAFPDDPDHFARWLRQGSDAEQAPAFASRQLFGTYLQQLLGDVARSGEAAGRLLTVADEVVDVNLDGPRPRLLLALGCAIEAERIVLATGNLPPRDLAGLASLDRALYVGDPWAQEAFAHWPESDNVLLVGTGLTAVDMVLRLRSRGHRGRITAVSRRGLRPRRHAATLSTASTFAVPERPSLTALLRWFRREVEIRGWHGAVDGLRPSVQRLWREASHDQRRRFLRHLRPWWDVHRHRVAPAVADILDDAERLGRLAFMAGRIEAVEPAAAGVDVSISPRGFNERRTIRVHRIVNCTGPAGDVSGAASPLLRSLLRQGLARPDACRLGLDVDPGCRIINAAGVPQQRLLAIGPVSRGAFLEVTAVPDIRVQAGVLAADLLADAAA